MIDYFETTLGLIFSNIQSVVFKKESSANEEYQDFLTSVLKENYQQAVLGDFNILLHSPDHIDT